MFTYVIYTVQNLRVRPSRASFETAEKALEAATASWTDTSLIHKVVTINQETKSRRTFKFNPLNTHTGVFHRQR